jgi:serine/threonine-protein kinase ATR
MAPYKLIHPYQDQIGPFIINCLSTQPDILGEPRRVMAIAPADFITITLPHTPDFREL